MSFDSDLIKDGERLDDLQFNGLYIIQDPRAFCFGTDAVLLSNFVSVKSGDTVVELGTGCGVILLLLAGRTEASRLIGVELQESVASMARRSVILNRLEHKIEIINDDLINIHERIGYGLADVVVCNPPYGKAGASQLNENPSASIARHEIKCTLSDCVKSASRLVRNGGRVAFVHKSDRLVDLIELMVENHIEPKRIRFVHQRADKPGILVLIEGCKLGRRGVRVLPSLVIWNESNEYTPEMLEIYHKTDAHSCEGDT